MKIVQARVPDKTFLIVELALNFCLPTSLLTPAPRGKSQNRLQESKGYSLRIQSTSNLRPRDTCRNAIPNCGRHCLPTNEHHARRASWMRTDRATSSIKGTSESSKRMITLHTRVLPERALIYTQKSVFTQKTKHQNTQDSLQCPIPNLLMPEGRKTPRAE